MVDDNSAPQLALTDSQGTIKSTFGIRKDEPIIALTNQTGKAGIVMSVNKKDVPNIQLSNAQNVPQLVMAVRDNNEPGMWLFDRGKIVRAGLSYADETGPRLGMRFLGRKPGLEMGLDDKLGPHLAMISESGDYLSYLGIPSGRAPNIGFFQGTQPLWSPAQSGVNLPGAELPPTDDILRELTR
ncbi:MAG: hypothetical protein KQH53_10055 [Desulfarculaceae bacterium]|nr:hypothetical protein [Desulfarculaceae bacterium]